MTERDDMLMFRTSTPERDHAVAPPGRQLPSPLDPTPRGRAPCGAFVGHADHEPTPFESEPTPVDPMRLPLVERPPDELPASDAAVPGDPDEIERLLARLQSALADARAALSERDESLTRVAHDLRAPLVAIGLGATSLIEDEGPVGATDGAQERRALLDLIQRSAASLSHMIEDLLDVARIARRTLTLRPVFTDVGGLVRDVVGLYRGMAEQRGITLRSISPPTAILATCDPDRITQALANLVVNALDFTPRGGMVELTVRASGRHVAISVRDSGAGIPEAAQRAIFERFTQLLIHTRKGLGLGLFIARGIIEGHGGALAVDSRVGHGSTFWFHLPRQWARG